jgi:hypothetical protein
MRAVDVQVLVLDEVHNILAGTFREQRIVLNTLRYLSNELKISLVCFGVKEAREAISGDVQLARRFEEFRLSRWSAEEGFEQLVLAIIRNLPLRAAYGPDGACRAKDPAGDRWHHREGLPHAQRSGGWRHRDGRRANY